MKNPFFLIILFLFITFSWSSCSESDPLPAAEPAWTWVFYLAGDNNLNSWLSADLAELTNSTWRHNILVLLDNSNGVSLYRIHNGTTEQLTAPQLGITEKSSLYNSGDPANLRAFVQWAASNRPAERLALTVGGHGDGWYPTARAIAVDEGSATRIGTVQLAAALQGLELDLLILDACLMATVETAVELSSAVPLLIASPAEIPAYGLDYSTILASLQQVPAADGAQLGKRILQLHPASTYSLIDTARLGSVVNNGLFIKLTNRLSDPLLRATVYSNCTKYSGAYPDQYVELPELARRSGAQQLESALLECITPADPAKQLSIYWPRWDGQLDPRYATNLAFSRITGWGAWLQQFRQLPPGEPENNRWESAQLLAGSTNLAATLSDSFDRDWLKLHTTAQQQLTVALQQPDDRITLQLYRPGKTAPLLCGSAAGDGQLQTNLNAGQWWIRVSGTAAVSYRLDLLLQ